MSAVVGVILVGHGDTASGLLRAARAIAGGAALEGVLAVDAGTGQTPDFEASLCAAIEREDRGAGVVLMVDLFGASPCSCALREGEGHGLTVVSGLNLAMLLKLCSLDRGAMSAVEIAGACAESGRKAVTVGGPRRAKKES